MIDNYTAAKQAVAKFNTAETWEEAEPAALELCALAGIPLRRDEYDEIDTMIEQVYKSADILGVMI